MGGHDGNQVRHAHARRALARAAAGGDGTLVDHPLLRLDVAGSEVYLEPDLVAFQHDGVFHVVEIKSFAVIDEQADGAKVAAAAIQSAVYVLALRRLLGDPDAVSHNVVLVCPKDFSNQPTAALVDVRKQLIVLEHQLARLARIDALLDALPPDLSLDLALTGGRRSLRRWLQVPARYAPDCLAACELSYFCRDEARGSTAALGIGVREELGGVETVAEALGLADGSLAPADDQTEAAALLRTAARVYRSAPAVSAVTSYARALAVAAGRAQPIATVRHLHVADRPLVLVPLDPGRRGERPAGRHGRLPPRTSRRFLFVAQPRNRDLRFAFAAALASTVLAVRRRRYPATSSRHGDGVRYADAPQMLVPNPGRHRLRRGCFGRSTRFRRADGPYPVHPSVPLLGRWLTWFAERAEHPGSSALLADDRRARPALGHRAERAGGRQPRRAARLDRPAAGPHRPRGRRGSPRTRCCSPPAGPTTDPGFDNEVLAPAIARSSTPARSTVRGRWPTLERLLRGRSSSRPGG